MRILVAGATGVLGSRVVRGLSSVGHVVYGTSRRPERAAALGAGATGLVMDALDRASVEAAFEEARPEAVVHLLTDLARSDFGANARLRVEGTANLVAAASAAGVGRMVAESIAWAYEPGETPAGEDEPLARDAATGEAAFASVEALEAAVLGLPEGVVLRCGLLYGPGTWYGPSGDQVAALRAGRFVATTAWTSFVQVDDAAEATLAALSWPAGAYNVVDDEPAHVREWGPLLAEAAGVPGVVPAARSEGRPASNARAKALGWEPRHPSWRTGLIGAVAADGARRARGGVTAPVAPSPDRSGQRT